MFLDDVRLPITIERGGTGGPAFATAVSEARSGVSVAVALRDMPLYKFDVGYGMRHLESQQVGDAYLEEIRNVFMVARGRLHSFRFRDWNDYQLTDELVGTGDGVETQFQAIKTYATGSQSFVRTLRALVNGTLDVKVDDVSVAFTADYETGLLTLGAAPAVDAEVTVTGEFDVAVRFKDDEFSYSYEYGPYGRAPSIGLQEVA